jgi:PPOX class probable F420-dependent enzyme
VYRGSEVPPEWEGFLERSFLARLGTLDASGFPHLTPVWFLYEDNRFFVSTTETAAKTRHVERDDRVGIVVDDPAMPYRVVVVKGRARIVREDIEGTTRRIAERYWPGWGVDDLVAELLAERRVLLEVRPERVVAWVE